jgi:hypothetical protein
MKWDQSIKASIIAIDTPLLLGCEVYEDGTIYAPMHTNRNNMGENNRWKPKTRQRLLPKY